MLTVLEECSFRYSAFRITFGRATGSSTPPNKHTYWIFARMRMIRYWYSLLVLF